MSQSIFHTYSYATKFNISVVTVNHFMKRSFLPHEHKSDITHEYITHEYITHEYITHEYITHEYQTHRIEFTDIHELLRIANIALKFKGAYRTIGKHCHRSKIHI